MRQCSVTIEDVTLVAFFWRSEDIHGPENGTVKGMFPVPGFCRAGSEAMGCIPYGEMMSGYRRNVLILFMIVRCFLSFPYASHNLDSG